MDNEFHELEAELKRLRPIPPSAMLVARVEQELRSPTRSFWTWTALPLAAALVGVVFLKDRAAVTAMPLAPARAAVTFKPVSAQNLLYDHRDEGLVTMADGTTAHRYLNSYVDTIMWKDPRTQASLRWSVPRTEVRVVPVSFQ